MKGAAIGVSLAAAAALMPAAAPSGPPFPAEGKAYPAPFDSDASYARELRVSPRGDDAGDGSRARPFRTLARAAREARPGTRIVLEAGTWPGGP